MESNIKIFLTMTSRSQYIFQWDSNINNYIVIKGNQRGFSIPQLLDIDYESTKEMLEEVYYHEDSNQNTKCIIREIIKQNKIKR